MRTLTSSLLLLLTVFASPVSAQEPAPKSDSPLAELQKGEVGTWKAEMKMWMNEQGQADASAQPQSFVGEETVRMLGDLWLVADFKVDMGGMPFEGHSILGYNAKTKKLEGTWIDSMTPDPAKMTGDYDSKTKTQTLFMEKPMPDGSVMKSKLVVVHSEGKRLFTMHDLKPGSKDEWIKSMEVVYTKKTESKH